MEPEKPSKLGLERSGHWAMADAPAAESQQA